MASWKHLASKLHTRSVASKLLTSNLLIRSVPQFRPAFAASRLFNTDSTGRDDDYRGPAAESFNEVYDELSTRRLNRLLKTPYTTRVIEPSTTVEKPECLNLFVNMSGVKEEDVKISVEDNTVFIEAEGDEEFKATRDFDKYNCWIDLPDNTYRINDIKAEMRRNLGELKLTVPKLKEQEKLKEEELVYNIQVNVKK